jgi:hypothetical protein
MLDHNYYDTLEEATVASIEMGVSAAYENYDGIQVRIRPSRPCIILLIGCTTPSRVLSPDMTVSFATVRI